MLVDSNVILDLFTDDPVWGDWSESMLNRYSAAGPLYINPIVYSEVSVGFARIEELERAIAETGLRMRPVPKEALFLAGKAFLRYRRADGASTAPLPDFYIGAQAVVEGLSLLTRDAARFQTYFPTVELVRPD